MKEIRISEEQGAGYQKIRLSERKAIWQFILLMA